MRSETDTEPKCDNCPNTIDCVGEDACLKHRAEQEETPPTDG